MSEKYWTNRYQKKLGSGKGSIGKVGKYKHEILKKYLRDYENFSFLDFGNGDLSFWKGNPPTNYVGIDIAENIQEINRKKVDRTFITTDLSEELGLKADVVICFDVLFHILEEVDYVNILINLSESSEKYIFIYNWITSPKNYIEDYQKFRPMLRYSHIFVTRGFKLVNIYKDEKIDPCGAMYVLRRE